MPLGGFRCDEVALFLNIKPSKTTQAMNPAFIKVARAFLYDPQRTMMALTEAMIAIERSKNMTLQDVISMSATRR